MLTLSFKKIIDFFSVASSIHYEVMNRTIFMNNTQFLNIKYIFQQYFPLTEKDKSHAPPNRGELRWESLQMKSRAPKQGGEGRWVGIRFVSCQEVHNFPCKAIPTQRGCIYTVEEPAKNVWANRKKQKTKWPSASLFNCACAVDFQC